MAYQVSGRESRHRSDPTPLAMIAVGVPLFIWSALNAGYFETSSETFIIPLAVFFGAPIALATAMWAYYHRDVYLATLAGAFGAFWISYGSLLWLAQEEVVLGETGGDIRGFLFVPWAVTFGLVWLASMRQHWSIGMVALGAAIMFALLGISYYADSADVLTAGGWVGFVTCGLAGYAALAEMVNIEFERPVLPTGPDFLDWWAERRARTH